MSLIAYMFLHWPSDRRQHQEFWSSEGQVWLLSQRPHRAVTTRRRHHKNPLQERSQRLVERRGVRQGEELKASCHQNIFSGADASCLTFTCLVFPGGLLSSQLRRGGLLRLLLTWIQRCMDSHSVCSGVCLEPGPIDCINACERVCLRVSECVCACMRKRGVLWLNDYLVMWIKLLFIWPK